MVGKKTDDQAIRDTEWKWFVPVGKRFGKVAIKYEAIRYKNSAEMRKATVWAQRLDSLSNLVFDFYGFKLHKRRPQPPRRKAHIPRFRRLPDAADEELKVVVHFGAQHLAETIPSRFCADHEDCSNTEHCKEFVGEYSDYCAPNCPNPPPADKVLLKPSGSTRLVFSLADRSLDDRKLSFKLLDEIFSCPPIVEARALDQNKLGVEQQLKVPFGSGIAEGDCDDGADPGVIYDAALAKIADSLKGISRAETSIEVVSGLHISPSETAGWKIDGTSKSQSSSFSLPLWNVRLDDHGRRTVRALFSDFIENSGEDERTDGLPVLPRYFDNGHALSRKDHMDLIAQTSLYGMPAIRAVYDSGVDGASTNSKGPLNRADVQLPETPPQFVSCLNKARGLVNDGLEDVGIAFARPFDDADITLSALGAIFAGEFNSDPFNYVGRPRDEGGTGNPAITLSLEKLHYLTWLGRDWRIEAVHKGYLFPLGLRASLVTLVRRSVMPFRAHQAHEAEEDSKDGCSVLERRQFIVVKNAPRKYPGPYHPYGARDFPPDRITMKTLVTPFLEMSRNWLELPRTAPNGEKVEAFWPIIRATGDEAATPFVFEWATDDVSSVRGELLFVLNDSVQKPRHLYLLAQYYNQESSPRNRVMLSGGRHTYAPSTTGETGKTSFDTHSWTLGVRGRDGRPDDETAHELDGRMVAADQPPFYPYMVDAEISVQSVDHVMRRSQGYVRAFYYDGYVSSGFNDANEAAEIFLTIDPGALDFDASSNSERLGGFASPGGKPAALSRKTGVVNGVPSLSGNPSSSERFPAAAEGVFEPEQFFSGPSASAATSAPKSGLELFNVDIIKLAKRGDLGVDAPSLRQTSQFSLIDSGLGGNPEIKRVLAAVAQKTTDVLYAPDGLVAKILELVTDPTQFKTYYGDLYGSLEPFLDRTAEQRLDWILEYANSESDDASNALLAASELFEDAQGLLDQIDDFVREPIPSNVRKVIEIFERLSKSTFETSIRGWFFGVIRELPTDDSLADWIDGLFCPYLDSGLGRVLLGESPRSCEQYLRRPELLFDDLESGVTGSLLTSFEDGVVAHLSELRDVVEGRVLGSRDEFVLVIEELLSQATSLVAGLLKTCDEESNNILCPEVQKEISERIRDAVFDVAPNGSRFPIDAKLSIEGLGDSLTRIRAAIDKVPTTVSDTLLTYTSKVHFRDDLPDPPTKQQILSRITSSIRRELRASLLEVDKSLESLLRVWSDVDWDQLVGLVARFAIERTNQFLKLHDLVKLPTFPEDWCTVATNTLKVFADSMMESAGYLDTKVSVIVSEASRISSRPNTPDEAKDALLWIQSTAEELRHSLGGLESARVEFAALSGDVCGEAATQYGALSARIVRARRGSYDQIIELIRVAASLSQSSGDNTAAATASIDVSEFEEITYAVKELLFGLSALSESGNDSLNTLRRAAREFQDLNVPRTLKANVESIADYLGSKFEQFQEQLSAVDGDIAKLSEAVDNFGTYITNVDRDFLGMLSASFVFPESLKEAIEDVTASGLRAVARPIAEGPYSALSELFTAIHSVLADDSRLVVFRAVFGDEFVDKVTEEFQNVFDAFKKERDLLDRIIGGNGSHLVRSQTVVDAREFAELVQGDSFHIEKAFALLSSHQLIDLQQQTTETLKSYLQGAREVLASLAKELLPTSVETSYGWKTALDADDDSVLLRFRDDAYLDPEKYGGNYHLALNATFSANPVSGQIQSVVEGHLSEFDLELFPGLAHVATITFEESRFRSVNGAKPNLSLDVKNVEIGEALEYLQALQEWLAPDGNGFYLTPFIAPEPGIEAGYEFTADLIQFGPLQFIDLGFGIAARLYFRGRPAEFEFRLANESRPFLIAAPPYGGGGWLKLVMQGDDVKSATMSFVYGGVSRIRFGPLKADGRVLVGAFVRTSNQNGKTECVVAATFEASGEGKIACFSISVCLLVSLTQSEGGDLIGFASFSFKFSMGIVKYRYTVTAGHTAPGSGKPAQFSLPEVNNALVVEEEPEDDWPTYSTNLPNKERNWKEYKKYFYKFDLDRARGVSP